MTDRTPTVSVPRVAENRKSAINAAHRQRPILRRAVDVLRPPGRTGEGDRGVLSQNRVRNGLFAGGGSLLRTRLCFQNSLLARNKQGIHRDRTFPYLEHAAKSPVTQCFPSNSLRQPNREFLSLC